MSKLRRNFLAVLAVLFCALLTVSTALIIPKTGKVAEAASGTAIEIYNDNYAAKNKNPFSAQKLRELYIILTGNPNASFNDVKTLVQNGDRTSDYIRGKNGGSNLSVMFGGLKWDAVYLTKARNTLDSDGDNVGDVVLDLWLSSDAIFSTGNWANSADGATDGYPSNMYSISVMRIEKLNAEGYIADSNRQISSLSSPKSNHDYARFTVATPDPSRGESVIDYIVQPKYVAYQEDEYSQKDQIGGGSDTLTAYNAPNDAYIQPAQPSSGNLGFYNDNAGHNFNYTQKAHYGDWQEDYLWLPSIAEAGRNQGTSETCGIWKADRNLRSSNYYTWLRSGMLDVASQVRCLQPDGGGSDIEVTKTSFDGIAIAVRPALHLNLTKANIAARGVSYDNTKTTNVEKNSSIDYLEDSHTFSHVYDGDDVEIELLERAKLKDITVSDYTSGASYNATSGKFIAKYPEQQPNANGEGDKTYEISVEPKAGYVWDDNDENEIRTYTVTISLATMTVGWQGFNAQLNDSLLLPNTQITVKGNAADSPLEVRYYIIEPKSTDTPPTNTGDWTERGTVTDPTGTSAGTYVVHYELKANYHKTEKSSYSVSVGVDNVTITANGSSAGDAIYCTGGTESITQQDWITKIKAAVNVTKDNQPYTSVDSLFDNLEVVLCTKNGNSYTPAIKNGQNCYDVGTYYLDLKFKSGASQAIQFVWGNNNRPEYEIKQETITVKVVADSADGLTHAYGDNHAAMKIVLNNGTTTLPDGGQVGDLAFGDYLLKTNSGDIVLDGTTPVGNGKVIADVSNIKNYKVQFETSGSEYTVTKRTVQLVVADESVGYGTDLTSHTFKSLTFADGESLVNNELLENVITSITYSIKANGVSFNLSDILPISTYDLSATATADNYIFKIAAGKLTITMANFDMDGVTVKSEGYIYDSNPHPAQLNGDLPSDEISVSYRYVNYDTGEELDGPPTEVGLYLVYATFTHSNTNYNQITDVLAGYIRISYTQDELNQPYPPLPTDAELAAAADLAKKKTEAKKTLDEEAKAKKDEIDADVNLTAEEKKAAKDEIDKELKEGNAAIDKATDKDSVDKAYDDGKKEIEDTTELAQKKGAAKSELDKAAQAKKDAIDANPELTDEEKAAAKAEVDKELEEGKKAIDGANSVDSVSSAESSTKTNIENIKAEHKGSFPWWILAIIAGAILLVTVFIIVIVKRRNADDDDGGYDDFYDDEYDYDEEEVEDDGDEEAYI